MIKPTVSKWLPKDLELANYYDGVDEFVAKHLELTEIKVYSTPKVILDPCVGYIEIQPWEMSLLDTHVFQQLRKITQLGLAYLVFPTLRYSRFEHTIGVLGRLDQMLKKLKDKHKKDADIISMITEYETTIRLAALFHDLGHCLFSHLSESIINTLPGNETTPKDKDYYPSTKTIKEKFNNKFKTRLSIAEILSITMMGCDRFIDLLEKANFKGKLVGEDKVTVPREIIIEKLGEAANFIAGIPIANKPKTVFLAQLISSGLDADKIDYMSREEHFSGIKVEMDLERILNKIKIQTIGKGIALQPGLKKYSQHMDTEETYYVLSIERGGQFAYEEFCVARLALYEKIYLHKKVRAAEQTLKNKLAQIPDLIRIFNYAHNWLYLPESIVENETRINYNEIQVVDIVEIFDGIKKQNIQYKAVSQYLKVDLSLVEKRNIPYRAFAFGPANATYDSNYYNLLDSALNSDDIESEIKNLISVRFWDELKEKTRYASFLKEIKETSIKILTTLIENYAYIESQLPLEDLKEFLKKVQDGDLENNLIIDVPDYNRVVLSFETIYFEESSFQAVRWTIPIHRISHYYQLHRILAYVYYEKKYCDIISLACQVASLTFIGKENGDRQVYDQRNFISSEIYNRTQSLKRNIKLVTPHMFHDKDELFHITPNIDNDHSSEIIRQVVKELNKYYERKFHKEELTYQDVKNYLRQFDDDYQPIILLLLASIRVLHDGELKAILESAFNDFNGKKINVIPLGSSFSSAPNMMKQLSDIITQYNVDDESIYTDKILEYHHFIFFDDNTNSGRQALNIIAKWCGIPTEKLKKKRVYTNISKDKDAKSVKAEISKRLQDSNTHITLCFITGTKEAEDFLLKNLKEVCEIKGSINIKIRHYIIPDLGILNNRKIPENYNNVFSTLKKSFKAAIKNEPSKLVEEAIQFLTNIGEQLVASKEVCTEQKEPASKHALGYCNRESTVIFFNSVPTSTITALWCSGDYVHPDNGMSKKWKPIIPRDKK
jgi:deoxynucleoside triphosphate triphosphohydrolase SAMHD1